tara:strand:- start:164 stop:547 length:384 start_codon:yes stop_codon:yes gene_type:complete
MASELRVNTLKDASGNNSVAMSNVAEGTAKAWVNINLTTPAIVDSHNIASLTDGGTGKGEPQYTNNFSNGNYSVVVSTGTSGDVIASELAAQATVDSSKHRIAGRAMSDETLTDYDIGCSQCCGDLA